MDETEEISSQTLAKAGGFSLHAGVSAKARQRDKIERLCRYIARPAVSTHRLERLPDGKISYKLKTLYKDGTTHVVFEPLDFIARLAALVPKPRYHLIRFYGVFAPNSKHRAKVTIDGRESKKEAPTELPVNPTELPVHEGRRKMSWSERLKRVFNIDITVCRRCQGAVRIIACIEDSHVISQILAHISHQYKPICRSTPGLGIRAPPINAKLQMNHRREKICRQ